MDWKSITALGVTGIVSPPVGGLVVGLDGLARVEAWSR